MRKKKHHILKLLLIVLVGFGVWIFFWDKPAPEKGNVIDLSNDVLQSL